MPSLDGPSHGLEACGRKEKAVRIDQRWNGCTACDGTRAIILPLRIQRDAAMRAQHGWRAGEHETTERGYGPTCTHRRRLHGTNRGAGDDANPSPTGMSDKTPTPAHPFRRHEAMLPFATVRRPLGERAKFREHAHQQFLATLHVQFSIDAPQIGVHRARRRTESPGRVALRRAVEDRPHDAALPRREAEAAREGAP